MLSTYTGIDIFINKLNYTGPFVPSDNIYLKIIFLLFEGSLKQNASVTFMFEGYD